MSGEPLTGLGPAAPRRSAVIAGRIATSAVVAFLAFSGGIKLVAPEPVTTTMRELGWPPVLTLPLGVMELAVTALYAVPRTARLGAVLLTGWLGGAVATHLRLLDPWLTHTLFPIWVGAVAWAGLLLRDPAFASTLLGAVHRPIARHGRAATEAPSVAAP